MSSLVATLRRPRRGAAVGLVVVVGLLVGSITGPASGDEITDARTEAERITDRIEELEHEAEVLTERYLDAQLARTTLEDQIADAEERADRSGAQLEEARTDLRDVAVEGYMSDGSTTGIAVLGASDAGEVSARRGYTAVLARDSDDLLDAYRGQERRADRDARSLDDLLAEAEAAEAEIDESRTETEARIAELQDLQEEVTGRLRDLVEAEQARRAEEAARRAAEADAAARAAREAAADTPAEPAPVERAPDADEDDAPTTTTTTTTAPPAEPAPTPAPPAPSPAPPAPAPPASGAEGAIAAARSVIGTPYRWAGASPETGFDCSGLIMWAYAQVGRSLPHSSSALYSMSRRISVDQLQPGDLVFYNSPVSHVGLYIGGGQMIHAPHTGSTVQIQSIHYWSALTGGGRI
ncbi:MAG TPA: NlpC/P60 family protein [Iamia sp.]|jgi:cell wall-associated NlpC family hydrolase/gas vesicle protein|nr:NlpC/P60 family protein [Iamia sp.]